ncbi:MAG: MerR family transcriptional regulator [Acidimicrobiales bacterium]|nr:MerR family transcriptional regulator [Acidimicrobiales bacterium]
MASDGAPAPGDPAGLSLTTLADESGLPARTIRYYQSERLLPHPERRGRDAVYREEHVQRLALIAELRDRGLSLGTIRELVTADHPVRTVAEWLGLDATLSAPWSDDRPRAVTREELRELVGRDQPGLLGELEAAGFVEPGDDGTWVVPSPALLDLALGLRDAGIDLEISGRLRDLLDRRLAQAVDAAVALLVARTGTGFAGNATPAELTTALAALRPAARDMTSLLVAHQVERALRRLVESGPAAMRQARRR